MSRIRCTEHFIVFSLENSFAIVLSGGGIMPSLLDQALCMYLTRQHYWKTVPSGEMKIMPGGSLKCPHHC